MTEFNKIALVAAMEREVFPLVSRWQKEEREHDGRRFKFFVGPSAVVVCGGIGAVAARRATEAVIALYHPAQVKSVGFAGALDPTLQAGDVVVPRQVVDAADGSVAETGEGRGILLTTATVAGAAQKSKLAAAYKAQAVDMEAASAARGAQARGIPFSAVKAISDDAGFELPAMERFIRDGQFQTFRFALASAVRPWTWGKLIKVARNANRASHALCTYLAGTLRSEEPLPGDMASVGGRRR